MLKALLKVTAFKLLLSRAALDELKLRGFESVLYIKCTGVA